MMHDREKSNSAIVATKPTNKAGATAAEVVLIARLRRDGAKGGDQEKRKRAKHVPDTELDMACHRRSSACGEPQGEIFSRAFPHRHTQGKNRMP